MDQPTRPDPVDRETAEQISQGGPHGVSTQGPPPDPATAGRRGRRAVGEARPRDPDEPAPSETTEAAPGAGPTA